MGVSEDARNRRRMADVQESTDRTSWSLLMKRLLTQGVYQEIVIIIKAIVLLLCKKNGGEKIDSEVRSHKFKKCTLIRHVLKVPC